ncbi:MAG: OmpA family protein [Myxococcota bacterium]
MIAASKTAMRILPALLLATAAQAQQAVDVVMRTVVAEGAQPSLQIQVLSDLRSLDLDLRGSRGTRLHRKLGAKRAGAVENLSWRHPAGDAERFEGALKFRPADGDTRDAIEELPIDFEAMVLTGLELRLSRDDVDLAKGELRFSISREAVKAEITIMGEKGQLLHQEEVAFNQERAGTPLVVRWKPPREPVARIDLRAYDKWDTFAGVALVPWKLEIPHEDVNFRTDSSQIDAPERPKLDTSYMKILDAITEHSDIGAIKLYVAGHTDTQASRDYNRKLSGARAQAIARYFKGAGLKIAIFAYGFGEDLPVIATPDDTDEPRNRRVDYVIAVEPPRGVPWQRVQ